MSGDCACAPFSWAEAPPPTANSTPFLCSCAKKRGGAPKKRAYGGRHGSCAVPPASPTNSKPQHHRRLRQADLSARSTTKPLPKSGEERPVHRGSSAHADGGAAGVKKRFSLAARHRFFGQAPKKWGRIAGQANDNLPTYRRTRGWWSRRGKKGACLWRLDTVSLGKHQRNGVERQDKLTTTAQRIGAHVQTQRKKGEPPARVPP